MQPLEQRFPTLGPQMFLDYNFQESCPANLVVKATESFSMKTSGDPSLETKESEVALILLAVFYRSPEVFLDT